MSSGRYTNLAVTFPMAIFSDIENTRRTSQYQRAWQPSRDFGHACKNTKDSIYLNVKQRNFDVASTVARNMWNEIAESGEDTVAVARASYLAGGNARHRLNSIAWLTFDVRFSSEARKFALELLQDRLSRVVEAAARALAWGWDVTLLPQMRKAAASQKGASRADILAAISAGEAGNPSLFIDRTNGGKLHMQVADHDWRVLRGGLVRNAQRRHGQSILAIARTPPKNEYPHIGSQPMLDEGAVLSSIEEENCWIVGDPISGYLLAQIKNDHWWINNAAVTQLGWSNGSFTHLLEFAEQEGRRRGFDRLLLAKCKGSATDLLCTKLGYHSITATNSKRDGEEILEKVFDKIAL